MSTQYTPPPFPPPLQSHPPIEVTSLHDVPSHPYLGSLSKRGYISLPLNELPTSLIQAYQHLFDSSRSFFEQSLDDNMKFHIPAKMQTSEEGFSVVEGEKHMITLRRQQTTPPALTDYVRNVWEESGKFCEEAMTGIAQSLGLPPDAFEGMVKPCVEKFPSEERVATLLRMFRYFRPEKETKVVSEGHKDLGLITLVVGHSPGLEVWDPDQSDWFSIEQPANPGELCVTLLAGQMLVRLTNGRYNAGKHRVRVHPSSDSSPYRFSLVYALRAHLPSIISSQQFTTPITGSFLYPFGSVTCGEMYKAISDAHFNVNLDPKLRAEQRKKIEEGWVRGATGVKPVSTEGKDATPQKMDVKVADQVGKKWNLKTVWRRTQKLGGWRTRTSVSS